MPFENTHLYLADKVRGALNDDELTGALKEHLDQAPEKFRRYRYSLSDYTATTRIDLPSSSVKSIARYCKEASRINPDAVVTIVAPQDLAYGLSRMWEAHMEVKKTGFETMTFRKREDADAWINSKMNGI